MDTSLTDTEAGTSEGNQNGEDVVQNGCYHAKYWTPAVLYRNTTYLVGDSIRRAGSDGIGRADCAKYAGVPPTKAGFRRNGFEQIFSVLAKNHPDVVGSFQKQEGRQRYWRYYWKTEPAAVEQIFKEFEEMTGRKLDMGQSIKFPDTNMKPLRLSDVTVRRLIDILKILRDRKYIVQRYTLQHMLIEIEKTTGGQHEIDSKSLKKLLKVLERWKLISRYETEIYETGIVKKVNIICEAGVENDAEILARALQEARDDFFKSPAMFQKVSVDSCPTSSTSFTIPHLANDDGDRKPTFGFDASSLSTYEMNELTEIPEEGLSIQDRLNASTFGRISVKKVRKRPRKTAVVSPGQIDFEPVVGNDDDSFGSTMNIVTQPTMDAIRVERVFDSAAAMYYGYQGRMYRLSIFHEFLFYLLYDYQGDGPRFYDKFPPRYKIGPNFYSACDDGAQPHVYLDVDDWRRFLPPIPVYTDAPLGWFMFNDIFLCLPLSVCVSILQTQFKHPLLDTYLADAATRHMLVADLPPEVRRTLWFEYRQLRQLKTLINELGLLGLLVGSVNSAEGATANRAQSFVAYEFFFLNRTMSLLDTSTSSERYVTVAPPIEQYTEYLYDFRCIDDVSLFWQHIKAITDATRLNHRSKKNDEDPQHVKVPHGKDALMSQIPKKSFDDVSANGVPVGERNGAAGFSHLVYAHLHRNWGLNSSSAYSQWFMDEWRRKFTQHKAVVSSRVARAVTVVSFIDSLLPSNSGQMDTKRPKGRASKVQETNVSSVPQSILNNLSVWKGKVPLTSRRFKIDVCKVWRPPAPRKVWIICFCVKE